LPASASSPAPAPLAASAPSSATELTGGHTADGA
jgi:hypothetical protein